MNTDFEEILKEFPEKNGRFINIFKYKLSL